MEQKFLHGTQWLSREQFRLARGLDKPVDKPAETVETETEEIEIEVELEKPVEQVELEEIEITEEILDANPMEELTLGEKVMIPITEEELNEEQEDDGEVEDDNKAVIESVKTELTRPQLFALAKKAKIEMYSQKTSDELKKLLNIE